jgi:aerobic-type carbon monoxide dehydrogenase small subunit (CoxS/CutS family)
MANCFLALAVVKDDAEVTTIDGSENGALLNRGAFHCGYCTSGTDLIGGRPHGRGQDAERGRIREHVSAKSADAAPIPVILAAI